MATVMAFLEKINKKWWMYIFIATPVLFYITMFLPYYNSGGSGFTSIWSIFWYPDRNDETIRYIASVHYQFRVNSLVSALLIPHLLGLFIIIFSLLLKGNGVVALLSGVWGLFGLVTLLLTPALRFTRVLAIGGITSILLMLIYIAACALSVLYFMNVRKIYQKNLAIYEASLHF